MFGGGRGYPLRERRSGRSGFYR